MTKLPSKKCIVCGRPVPRWTIWYAVWPLANRDGRSTVLPMIDADLRSMADCHRHTNLPFILSARRDTDGFVTSFTAWDGESYHRQGYFCTGRCAEAQGFASAQNGTRFQWKTAQ